MAMSARNARAAGATATYDYAQTSNTYYNDIVGQYSLARAIPGLCLGTTIHWLAYRRGLQWGQPDHFVGQINNDTIRQYTIRILNSGNNWMAECDAVMRTLGFREHYDRGQSTFYDAHLPARAGWGGAPGAEFLSDSDAKEFCIVGAYLGQDSHAMGLHLRDGSVFFFDPNEGYAFFPVRHKFLNWFANTFKPTALSGFHTATTPAMSCFLMCYSGH
jgi:hypothetical protein